MIRMSISENKGLIPGKKTRLLRRISDAWAVLLGNAHACVFTTPTVYDTSFFGKDALTEGVAPIIRMGRYSNAEWLQRQMQGHAEQAAETLEQIKKEQIGDG